MFEESGREESRHTNQNQAHLMEGDDPTGAGDADDDAVALDEENGQHRGIGAGDGGGLEVTLQMDAHHDD